MKHRLNIEIWTVYILYVYTENNTQALYQITFHWSQSRHFLMMGVPPLFFRTVCPTPSEPIDLLPARSLRNHLWDNPNLGKGTSLVTGGNPCPTMDQWKVNPCPTIVLHLGIDPTYSTDLEIQLLGAKVYCTQSERPWRCRFCHSLPSWELKMALGGSMVLEGQVATPIWWELPPRSLHITTYFTQGPI